MVPRLVPEISSLDAFCDTGAAVVGIGDSRSWIKAYIYSQYTCARKYIREEDFSLECALSPANLPFIEHEPQKPQLWEAPPLLSPGESAHTLKLELLGRTGTSFSDGAQIINCTELSLRLSLISCWKSPPMQCMAKPHCINHASEAACFKVENPKVEVAAFSLGACILFLAADL